MDVGAGLPSFMPFRHSLLLRTPAHAKHTFMKVAETSPVGRHGLPLLVDALQAARCAKKDVSCFRCSLPLLGCTAVLGLTPGGGPGPEAVGGRAAAAQRCSLHLQGASAGPPRMIHPPPHPAPR